MTPESNVEKSKAAYVTTYSHFTGAVFGCGLGFLLGTKLGDQPRKIAGITLMSVGSVAILPYAIYLAYKILRSPYSQRIVKRKLRGIRSGGGYEYDEETYDPESFVG